MAEETLRQTDAAAEPKPESAATQELDPTQDALLSEEMDGADMPVPPADFSFLVYSLTTQAQLQLGLFRLDPNEPPRVNLSMARHTIDMLAMLQQKTAGNLSLQEKLLLENTLTDLRFRFVQASAEPSKI